MSPRLHAGCQALLALNVAYSVAAVAIDELPGWKMFQSVEALDYELLDAQGGTIVLESVLPKNAYLVDYAEVRRIAGWYCKKYPGQGPFTYREVALTNGVVGPKCHVDAAR